MMQPHDLVSLQRGHCVGSPLVIAEFDFVDARNSIFHYGADLAADQAMFGQILEQCNHCEHFNFGHGKPSSSST